MGENCGGTPGLWTGRQIGWYPWPLGTDHMLLGCMAMGDGPVFGICRDGGATRLAINALTIPRSSGKPPELFKYRLPRKM